MIIKEENRKAIVLFVLIGLLSSILLYQTIKPFGIDGHTAIHTWDTFLYMQYAKAWANGHPYQFDAEDPPTTGSTSHIYPMILGLFYFIGFKDLALVDVAYWLNTLFLILSIIIFWFIVKKIEPEGRWWITFLYALSGYFTIVFLGLSDMGLFTLATLLFWHLVLSRKYIAQSIVLFLLPLTRPEGLFIVGLYPFILWREKAHKNIPIKQMDLKQKAIVLFSGIAGVLAMFLINYVLTGFIHFDSTREKGFFYLHHFLTALYYTVGSGLDLFKGVFFGLENNTRQYLYIPVVGGLLILIGLLKGRLEKQKLSFQHSVETWWLFSILLSFIMVAGSGWQGLHHDRYLVWMLPLMLVYLFRGIRTLPLNTVVKKGLCISFILFQLVAYPFFIYERTIACAKHMPSMQAIQKIYRESPQEKTVGLIGGSGVKYLCPKWHVINLGVVTSPYFRDCKLNLSSMIKILQHRPSLQFDTFIKVADGGNVMRQMVLDSLIVEVHNPYKKPVTIYNMDWKAINRGRTPLQDNLLVQIPDDHLLVDYLDIANMQDEKRTNFKTYSPFAYNNPVSVLTEGTISGEKFIDTIQPILGGAFFQMKTSPGKDHWLVIRIALKEKVIFYRLDGRQKPEIDTSDMTNLILKIDYEHDIQVEMNITEQNIEDNFVEKIVRIPNQLIKSEKTDFAIIGDHLLCDVWLYASGDLD